ncbi:hypothetical protein JNB11_06940 [Kocuria palustris]|nr:hypothetical protein [Kocuria palustris]
MVLTSAQRGDKVEGWNDCPVVSASSLTSLVAKSKRTRVYHSSNNNLVSDLNHATVSSPPPSTASLAVISPPTPPPTSLSTLSLEVPPETEDKVTPLLKSLDPKELLEQVLAKTKLLDKEKAFYEAKIPLDTMNATHKEFVATLLGRALIGENLTVLKKDLVEFMVCSDGVSSWCSALKKILSSI